jgi:hypothetical protein
MISLDSIGSDATTDSDEYRDSSDLLSAYQAEAYAAYRQLAEGEIRLLVLLSGEEDDGIQCTTATATLASKPTYEAVSYAWGSSSDLSGIELDGKVCLVRHNLVECLRRLRYRNESRSLWVDALCTCFLLSKPSTLPD